LNQRGTLSVTRRKSFALLARAAIEKHVPESRPGEAHWALARNAVWVRWPREDGRFAYLGIHRHLDWVSGEAGTSDDPRELEDLTPVPGVSRGPGRGGRVRLGVLLEGEDRWWPVGPDEPALIGRLEWMVLQLRVKAEAYFARPRERR
jgi:hypothetical protein